MLSSPINSTPFSVKDILNLKRQQDQDIGSFLSDTSGTSGSLVHSYPGNFDNSVEIDATYRFHPSNQTLRCASNQSETLITNIGDNMASRTETTGFSKPNGLSNEFSYLPTISPPGFTAETLTHAGVVGKCQNSSEIMNFPHGSLQQSDNRTTSPLRNDYYSESKQNIVGFSQDLHPYGISQTNSRANSVPKDGDAALDHMGMETRIQPSVATTDIRMGRDIVPTPHGDNFAYENGSPPLESHVSTNYLSSSTPNSTSPGYLHRMGYVVPYTSSSPTHQHLQDVPFPYNHSQHHFSNSSNNATLHGTQYTSISYSQNPRGGQTCLNDLTHDTSPSAPQQHPFYNHGSSEQENGSGGDGSESNAAVHFPGQSSENMEHAMDKVGLGHLDGYSHLSNEGKTKSIDSDATRDDVSIHLEGELNGFVVV